MLKMIESLKWSLARFAPLFSGALIILFAPFVFTYLTSPVRSIPGPLIARFSDLWRLYLVWKRSPEKEHHALHKKYGSAVVLGPNMVSINDPELIKVIYSRKDILIKVRFIACASKAGSGNRSPKGAEVKIRVTSIRSRISWWQGVV